MTFLPDSSPASTPKLKLSLLSLPSQPQEPPGMLTPPLRPPSSVPFLWEEAPGKPRLAESSSLSPTRCNTTLPRCLELPPRLLAADASSPSTVLDGPYVGRSMSHSTVFRRERFDDVGLGMSKGKQSKGNNNNNDNNNNNNGYFVGLGRKFGSMRHTRVWESSSVASPSSSSMSEFEGEKKNGVKITRSRRHRSFFRSSKSRSTTHILAGIFGTFKQVVPLSWRTRKIKRDVHFI